MKRARKKMPTIIAVALVLSTLMVLASTAFAATSANVINATPKGESIHEKIDISEITGEIAEPPELTSAASALAKEKEWYEYVYYSKVPVGYYYLSDGTRLAFYDPYDYASSLIMEVNDDITDWSSMNSLQISYTTGDSLTETTGSSTDVSTSVEVATGKDISDTYTDKSVVTTTVAGKVETYNVHESGGTETTNGWALTETKGQDTALGVMVHTGVEILNTEVNEETHWTHETGGEESGSTAHHIDKGYEQGWTEDKTTTTSTTDAGHSKVVSTIADRVSRVTGSSDSTSVTMETNNSKTITKTYEAGYFNSNGSPLQWKIIHYKVMMPMKYQVEYLIDDEWVFGDYNYCLLTTIQGTCRSWLQNNVAYYEHWGTGEPVTWDEFWNQFFTKENLIKAYQSKLYPEN